jgi:hypothetical protein
MAFDAIRMRVDPDAAAVEDVPGATQPVAIIEIDSVVVGTSAVADAS